MTTPRRALPAPRAPATVICLHSSASSARQWSSLADALLDAYCVLAPDLIGYGAAPDWTGMHAPSLDDEARRIEPQLAGAGECVHLVGHSFGGAVALQLALRNPGRVRSISLFEPVLFTLLDGDSGSRAEAVEIRGVREAVRDALEAGCPEAAAQLFVDYWSGLGAWRALPANRRQAIVARMPKVNAEFDALFGSSPPADRYRRIDAPVLLLTGTVSRRPTRRAADRLCGLLADATRQDISGAGHMGPITHADSINACVRAFLDAQQVAAPMARAA